MKTLLRFAAAGVLVAGLVACAGTSQLTSAAPTAYQGSDQLVTDSEYVAFIERMARQQGAEVRWVNPPTKRVVATTPQ